MNDQIDSSIPVLTEVIAASPATPASEPKPAVQKPSAPSQSAKLLPPRPVSASAETSNGGISQAKPSSPAPTATSLPAVQATPLTESHAKPLAKIEQQETLDLLTNGADNAEAWSQIEQSVKENVLRQVLSRVDFVLEHRVRDSLADVLQNTVDQLADDIRAGLRKSLDEVITRAVTQELTRIKGNKQ